MALTHEEVQHIAELARLALSEEELVRYQEQLSDILDYAERLQAIDTEDIPPTASVLALRTVLREDEAAITLDHQDALRNAPDVQDDYIVVPPVR
jgi:aspartyl-tRNA(Asn)/glutamyl-tRNA(Gln) amidotransferase subunit C